MSGLLAQAIAQLTSNANQIKAQSASDPTLESIRTKTGLLLDDTVTLLQNVQTDTLAYVTSASADIGKLQTMAGANQPAASMQPTVTLISQGASSLQTEVQSALKQVSNLAEVMGQLQDLVNSNMLKLQSQNRDLNARMSGLQASVSSAKSEYLRLLALGVLAGAGNAAAALLQYEALKSAADRIQQEVNDANQAMADLKVMMARQEVIMQGYSQIALNALAQINSATNDMSLSTSDLQQQISSNLSDIIINLFLQLAQSGLADLKGCAS